MQIQLSTELQAILEERLVYTSEFINEAIWLALESDEFKKNRKKFALFVKVFGF